MNGWGGGAHNSLNLGLEDEFNTISCGHDLHVPSAKVDFQCLEQLQAMVHEECQSSWMLSFN